MEKYREEERKHIKNSFNDFLSTFFTTKIY